MKYLAVLFLLTFAYPAFAIDASQSDVSNFVTNHVNAVKACNYQVLVKHINENFADTYVETDIYNGEIQEKTTKATLLKYAHEDFSNPNEPMTAEDCQLNLALSQSKFDKDRAIFQTIEDDFGTKRVCNHFAHMNGNQFQILKTNCKYYLTGQ